MERWIFFQNAHSKWCWRRMSDRGLLLKEGSIWFTSRDDCVRDATAAGYDEDAADPAGFSGKHH
jgi:hypothetical protein